MSAANSRDIGVALCRIIALALLAAAGVLLILLSGHKAPAFGDVRACKDTDIVADPHVPLDASRNVIWCGTMALAWNEAIAKYNGPLVFTPSIPTAEILNLQEFTSSDLDAESYVVMAGYKLDEIDKKFRAEVWRKFGDGANPPQLSGDDPPSTSQDVIIYAYLLKSLLFTTPFNQNEHLQFEGTKVASFGFGFETSPSSEASGDMTSEIRLLDYQSEDNFIIELKTKSPDDQLVLAKIPAQKTLQETIDSVVPKIDPKSRWGIDSKDKLSVPKISFDLTKHFTEFEGQSVRGGRLNTVAENLVFRLDQKGAELKVFTTISETLAAVWPPPKPLNLVFDKPFLLLLKRTTSRSPYFAMWVGNPTLLVSP